MIRHVAPEVFYEELGSADRAVLDAWSERRSILLHERMMDEMKSRLCEHGVENLQSIRFLRMHVQSVSSGTDPGSEATLTIWNPSDDTVAELRKGLVIRAKMLDVKPTRFDGRKHLNAGSCSQITILNNPPQAPVGRITSLFRLLLHASSLSEQNGSQLQGVQASNICSIGIVLFIEYNASDSWSLVLTDSSGIMLRVESDVQCNELTLRCLNVPHHSYGQTMTSFGVVMIRDLILVKVNVERSFIHARFTKCSTFEMNLFEDHPHANALYKWEATMQGKSRLIWLVSLLRTSSNLQICENQTIVMGYIVDFELYMKSALIIQVDCDHSGVKALKFPIALLPSFLDNCQDPEGLVFLSEQDDTEIRRLNHLGRLISSRQVLYCFSLKPYSATEGCNVSYEVSQVTRVEASSLASVYISRRMMASLPCLASNDSRIIR